MNIIIKFQLKINIKNVLTMFMQDNSRRKQNNKEELRNQEIFNRGIQNQEIDKEEIKDQWENLIIRILVFRRVIKGKSQVLC